MASYRIMRLAIVICYLSKSSLGNYLCAQAKSDGSVAEVILGTKREADQCEEYFPCKCEVIMVFCLVGPDSMGNFQRLEAPRSYADSCDREKCVCATHDNYA